MHMVTLEDNGIKQPDHGETKVLNLLLLKVLNLVDQQKGQKQV